MKHLLPAILVLAVMGLLVSAARAAGEAQGEAKPQTKCPVMGDDIDKQYFVDYNGKRVYFCCPMCAPEFNKEPDKYIKKLEDAGVTLEKTPVAQTTCPVTGDPIDKQYFVDYNGKRVYFCCANCPAEFSKDPDKYIKKLEEAGVTLDKTPVAQTTCPVTGDPIDKQYFADYNGKRVYFCCANCPADFSKDPDKYVKKLEDAGVTLDKTPVVEKPQTMCPIMDRPINKKIFADYEGKRVYFCCRVCQNRFKRDPAKWVKQLEDEGITLEKVPGSS